MANDLPEGAVSITSDDLVGSRVAQGPVKINPADILPSGRAKEPKASPATTLADDIKALPGKIWGGAKSLVTGEGRREEGIDELPDEFVPGFGSISSRMSMARSPEGKRDIYKEAHPEAKIRTDAYGNPIVTPPDAGKEYYLNKPGASWQDIPDTVTEAAFLVPGIRGGAAVGKALGPLGRIAGSGAGSGAASIAQDVASREAGSEQPVDLPGALTYAAVGAGGEMLSPLLSPLAQRVMRKPMVDPATGKLTAHGQEALRNAGIDPNAVTESFARRFALDAEKAVNSTQAARATEASTLPVPVPQSRGMVSGVPAEQMFEDLSAKGAYGETASAITRAGRDDTMEALNQNLPAIQAAVAKGQPTMTATGQAGPVVQKKLAGMAAAEKAGVDAAYASLRSSDASLARKGVEDIRATAREALADHDLLGLPATSRFMKQLDDMVDAIPVNAGKDWSPPSQPIRTLIDMDKRITNAQKAGGEEAMALGKIKKAIRTKLDDALAEGLIMGDEKTIDLFKNALAAHREYAKRFKGDNVVGALVEKKKGEPGVLAVSPEEASNVLFGSNRLFGGPEASRNIARLKTILGPDSPEWNAVREEAWMRFARAGEGAVRPDGTRAFSGAKFAKALDDTMRDYPAAMKAMFSPEEISLMQQFKRVAARTTIPVEGGKNFSNTTPAAANVVQNLLAATFMGENAAARLISTLGVKSVYKMGMAFKAAGHRTGRAAERKAAPGTAGTGVTLGSEMSVEDRVRSKLDALATE